MENCAAYEIKGVLGLIASLKLAIKKFLLHFLGLTAVHTLQWQNGATRETKIKYLELKAKASSSKRITVSCLEEFLV